MDFGELKSDINFVDKVTQLDSALKEIDEQISKCIAFPQYDKLKLEEKVKFDLYLSYTINSLYYMYVKLQGMDPNTHGIKNEISRVRQSMLREKQIYENKTLRPTIDKGAAGRFIKHGIHYREDRNNEQNQDEREEQIQNGNEEAENSNSGRFVKLNQNKLRNERSNHENDTVQIESDDTENDEPTAKKVRKESTYVISDDSDSNQKSIKKTKKKKKRKSFPIN